MVKLPGAVTKGGHEPATRPLPFLTWIFYRTISEIKGSRYLRSPYHVFSSGSRACPFADFSGDGHSVIGAFLLILIRLSHHRAEMRKVNLITPWSLPTRWSLPCFGAKQSFEFFLQRFLLLSHWPLGPLSVGQIACLHTQCLCLWLTLERTTPVMVWKWPGTSSSLVKLAPRVLRWFCPRSLTVWTRYGSDFFFFWLM